MRVCASISTMYGRRRFSRPPLIRLSVTPHELHVLVRQVEREAVEAEQAGLLDAADSLAWRAAALREAGR